ncbi:MAG: ABC transporter permease [Acidimicrobiia bacterium]|nr:ABC transporter permease [Acidimicrobiia bacterium]
MTSAPRSSAALTRFVVASRYMPVYLALALLVGVAAIWAPAALSGSALRAIAPAAAILGIVALGQMLVIMTGGIDLSIPGTFSLAAVIMVGVGNQGDGQVVRAILVAAGVAAVIGLVNGLLIGGLKLNALIVTLAVGQLVAGVVNRYGRTFPVQQPVPTTFSEWASSRFLGMSPIFWLGLGVMFFFVLAFRYTGAGRRFQAVGANPTASQVVGVRVTVNQIGAYVLGAVLYAIGGVLLAGLIRTPGVASGDSYLLAPIAAVVIGGASLTGGLASSFSTFTAAFFLTGLNRMMLIMGLSTAWQFVVFGVVIIAGMLVSGDRIIKGVERVLRERRSRASPVGIDGRAG